jgi:hypothetical protein
MVLMLVLLMVLAHTVLLLVMALAHMVLLLDTAMVVLPLMRVPTVLLMAHTVLLLDTAMMLLLMALTVLPLGVLLMVPLPPMTVLLTEPLMEPELTVLMATSPELATDSVLLLITLLLVTTASDILVLMETTNLLSLWVTTDMELMVPGVNPPMPVLGLEIGLVLMVEPLTLDMMVSGTPLLTPGPVLLTSLLPMVLSTGPPPVLPPSMLPPFPDGPEIIKSTIYLMGNQNSK